MYLIIGSLFGLNNLLDYISKNDVHMKGICSGIYIAKQ